LESIFFKSDSREIILHAHLPVLSVFSGVAARTKNHRSENNHDHSCKTCNGDCANKMQTKATIDETHPTA
jgi:hypothetical protein